MYFGLFENGTETGLFACSMQGAKESIYGDLQKESSGNIIGGIAK
jgi:hypothetical protein